MLLENLNFNFQQILPPQYSTRLDLGIYIGLERVGRTQNGLGSLWESPNDLRTTKYSRFMGRMKKKSEVLAFVAVGIRVGRTKNWLTPEDLMGLQKKSLVLSWLFLALGLALVGRTKNWLTPEDLMGLQKKSLVLSWLFLALGLALVGLVRNELTDRMGLQKKSGARFSTTSWAGSAPMEPMYSSDPWGSSYLWYPSYPWFTTKKNTSKFWFRRDLRFSLKVYYSLKLVGTPCAPCIWNWILLTVLLLRLCTRDTENGHWNCHQESEWNPGGHLEYFWSLSRCLPDWLHWLENLWVYIAFG